MKIGIVGAGFVGSTGAYAMLMQGVGREIVLVDLNRERAEAEAADLRHATPFSHPLQVRAGDYKDLTGARLVVICAGVNQKPGETRLQLLERNAAVFEAVVPQIVKAAPGAVLLIATNPVDIMTHLTARIAAKCGGDANRVLGSGTTLDSARFRSLLGEHCGVDAHHIHGYVIGEHGDSEVLTWSLVTVAGVPWETFLGQRGVPWNDEIRDRIDQQVRRAAYTIIQGKGATYYGIGSALARIAKSILGDQRSVLTCCRPTPDVAGVKDVTVALPRLVGGTGVLDTFPPPLSADEQAALAKSARIVRDALDALEK